MGLIDNMNSWSKPKIGIIANRKNRNKLESYKYRENLYYTEKVPWLHFTYNFLVTLFLPNMNTTLHSTVSGQGNETFLEQQLSLLGL